jgi:hypothetical protein
MKQKKPLTRLLLMLWIGLLCCSPTLFAAENASLKLTDQITVEAISDGFSNDLLNTVEDPEPVLCSYSVGYWFAKPGIVWPYDVVIGGETYTQAQGQTFWPPATVTSHAFTQYAAIYLSGTSLEYFPTLEANMQIIDDYFANDYPDPAGEDVNEAAGYIGQWISDNHCGEGCPDLDVVITVTPATCPDSFDGEIHVAMNGAKPFDICIHFGCQPDELAMEHLKTQTAHYTGLAGGWWLVSVVDANGCEFFECVYVPVPDPIEVEVLSTTDVLCPDSEDGTATISVSGGTPPFTINGDTFDGPEFTIEGLAAGSHTFEVDDANSCGPVSFTFEIGEPEPITASVTYDPIECYEGTTMVDVTAEGGTGTLSLYNVVDGELVFVSELPLAEPIELGAGTYVWVVMDENECHVDLNFELEEPEQLVADVVYEPIDCFEGTTLVDVVADGGTGTLSLYDVVDGELVFVSELPLAEPLELGAGSYSWVVMDENECTVDLEFELEDPEQLLADVSYEPIDCFEGTTMVDVIASGGTGTLSLYDVVDGELVFVSELPLAEPLELGAGSYSWVVMDENDCTADLDFELEDPEQLLADVSYEPIDCYEGTTMVDVIASGGTGTLSLYDVVDGELVFVSELPLAEPLELGAGSYSWVVMDENNCTADLDFELEDPEQLLADVSYEPIDCFEGTTLADVVAEGGTGTLSLYDVVDGELVFVSELPLAEPLELGAGSYSWVVMDENECSVDLEFELEDPEQLLADVSYEPIDCFEGTTMVDVIASGGTGTLSLFNVVDDELVFVSELPLDEPLELGAGSYSWVVMDENECHVDVEFTLTQPEELIGVLVETTDPTCYEGTDGMAVIEISGGIPPYSADMGEVVENMLTITNLSAGVYTVNITDSKNCGPAEVTFEIEDPDPVVVSLMAWLTFFATATKPALSKFQPLAVTVVSCSHLTVKPGRKAACLKAWQLALIQFTLKMPKAVQPCWKTLW